MPEHKTAYFTFGQCHIHTVNGMVFDKDTVVEITSPDPRETMFEIFGCKWSMQYHHPPDLKYFPGGIIKL
jgi:hypothetical protein